MMEKEIKDKLDTFKYALEDEVQKRWNTPCRVLMRDTNPSNNGKFKLHVDVQVQTNSFMASYVIWQANSRDEVYWERVM